jgi:hypothetical protein
MSEDIFDTDSELRDVLAAHLERMARGRETGRWDDSPLVLSDGREVKLGRFFFEEAGGRYGLDWKQMERRFFDEVSRRDPRAIERARQHAGRARRKEVLGKYFRGEK